jgi:hypothetical protein
MLFSHCFIFQGPHKIFISLITIIKKKRNKINVLLQ